MQIHEGAVSYVSFRYLDTFYLTKMPENVSEIQERVVSFVSSDTVSKILPNPGFYNLFIIYTSRVECTYI